MQTIGGVHPIIQAYTRRKVASGPRDAWWLLATPRVARSATFLVCERQMIVNKHASPRTLGSDLARVDAHVVKPVEYKELPELTDDMLSRAVVKKGGRPKSASPRQLISLRLPADVISRWRATGPRIFKVPSS